jgi:hypothetical protein
MRAARQGRAANVAHFAKVEICKCTEPRFWPLFRTNDILQPLNLRMALEECSKEEQQQQHAFSMPVNSSSDQSPESGNASGAMAGMQFLPICTHEEYWQENASNQAWSTGMAAPRASADGQSFSRMTTPEARMTTPGAMGGVPWPMGNEQCMFVPVDVKNCRDMLGATDRSASMVATENAVQQQYAQLVPCILMVQQAPQEMGNGNHNGMGNGIGDAMANGMDNGMATGIGNMARFNGEFQDQTQSQAHFQTLNATGGLEVGLPLLPAGVWEDEVYMD